MPHQLRRVITINIRNPNGGLPSGRIAELDPRGGVLAVGDNGVGKTTFLRLLPLFYGATPTQILKGTGRSVMISHALPDASSAVCYEYERESENDLRCVVMHARANEEAPQFHILHSGYREEFFYDENNQYVDRDEFKARVEAMGIEVTRKLLLHQYRSVILNERLPTKEGAELRRLAAVHSLGPKPLYNLDQISAAMANEKISFRDLQNIVLERVSDSPTASNRTTNVKELKQNRESVVRWLEARSHLADIMARKPDAQKITERIGKVKSLHLELCTLHVAVKAALVVAKRELDTLTTDEIDLRARLLTEAQDLELEINRTSGKTKEAKAAADDKWQSCEAARQRLQHFEKIQVEFLTTQQENETNFSEQASSLGREIKDIQDTAGDVDQRASERRRTIEKSFRDQELDIRTRLSLIFKEFGQRREALHNAQQAAEAQIPLPSSSDSGEELLRIAARAGELSTLIQRPTPSPGAQEQLDAAASEADIRQDEWNQAQSKLHIAESDTRKAKETHDEVLANLRHLESESEKLSNTKAQTQAQLTPPPGSLLEFIRNADGAVWANASKVLDPALLTRTDLSPIYPEALVNGEATSEDTAVTVGPALLQLDEVETPPWVDMVAVREELQRLGEQMDSLGAELQSTQDLASRARGAYQRAQDAQKNAEAFESLAQSALDTAKGNRLRLARFAQEEAIRRRDEAIAENLRIQERKAQLIEASQQAETKYRTQLDHIKADFDQQRKQLSEEQGATEDSLNDALASVASKLEEALKHVSDDVARELAGLGIDPVRLENLQKKKQALEETLSGISRNRHEVLAWKAFRSEVLPSMESEKTAFARLKADHLAFSTRLTQLQNAQVQAEEKGKKAQQDIANALAARNNEIRDLQSLVDRGLKDFVDYVPAKLSIDWTVTNLQEAVSGRKRDLEQQVEELNKQHRSLRNELLKHAGGPADWLEHKEAELPDRQIYLEHQYLCAQAQVVCDWYDPMECGPYIDQLSKEMLAFFHLAGEFVRMLDQFERRVTSFNSDLQKALGNTERFERFRDLSVTVSSKVSQLGYIKLLREMQDKGTRNPMAYRTVIRSEQDMPTDEDASLIRGFRDILQSDGAFKVNLNEQVRLECALYENGVRRSITNEEEFRAVSSNGNTALITAMFLVGFVQMIRGDSPVRLTWVSDEIGRFDPKNLGAFLKTLDMHKIDVISACPSIDPALARFFPRLCIFESNGAVLTSHTEEFEYAEA